MYNLLIPEKEATTVDSKLALLLITLAPLLDAVGIIYIHPYLHVDDFSADFSAQSNTDLQVHTSYFDQRKTCPPPASYLSMTRCGDPALDLNRICQNVGAFF